jgi:hypothetical protein
VAELEVLKANHMEIESQLAKMRSSYAAFNTSEDFELEN